MPQNRPQVYFVCIRKDSYKEGAFNWPESMECSSVERFLEQCELKPTLLNLQLPQGQASEKWTATMAKLLRDAEPLQHTYLFNLHGSIGYGGTAMLEKCPCLCRSDGDVWISSHGRAFNLRERCRLQGMSPDKLKVVVSGPQWRKQLGNAMSVNMLGRLLARLLPAAG